MRAISPRFQPLDYCSCAEGRALLWVWSWRLTKMDSWGMTSYRGNITFDESEDVLTCARGWCSTWLPPRSSFKTNPVIYSYISRWDVPSLFGGEDAFRPSTLANPIFADCGWGMERQWFYGCVCWNRYACLGCPTDHRWRGVLSRPNPESGVDPRLNWSACLSPVAPTTIR